MAAELKPYRAYKDSGVEWLGEVPAHWEVRRLRNICRLRVSNVDKHTKEGEVPVRLCNYVDVYKNDRILSDLAFMAATATESDVERFRLRSGDVLITKDSEAWNDIGVPAFVQEVGDDVVSGYHLALLRPDTGRLHGGFLFRAMESRGVGHQLHVRANGVTRYGLSHDAIKSIRLPAPPPREQAAIVRFLDHADQRIRRYIRAKEKLIALLEEQKQAVVHEAVTGRIDVRTGRPYPAYKDSGSRWLGKVPAHWDVRRLRTISDMRVSNVDKHSRAGEQPIHLCNYVDVYKADRIRPEMPLMSATATSEEIEKFRLWRGDVLITKDSETWNDIGVAALVEGAADNTVCGYHLALLRPFSDLVISSEYLFQAVQSSAIAYQLHVRANGVTRFGLTHNAIKSTWLPVPPLPEQAAIVRFLDRVTDNMRAAVTNSRRHIEHVREYRARLIADVVTGKLDVREAAARLPEMPEIDPLGGDDGPNGDDQAADVCVEKQRSSGRGPRAGVSSGMTAAVQ